MSFWRNFRHSLNQKLSNDKFRSTSWQNCHKNNISVPMSGNQQNWLRLWYSFDRICIKLELIKSSTRTCTYSTLPTILRNDDFENIEKTQQVNTTLWPWRIFPVKSRILCIGRNKYSLPTIHTNELTRCNNTSTLATPNHQKVWWQWTRSSTWIWYVRPNF